MHHSYLPLRETSESQTQDRNTRHYKFTFRVNHPVLTLCCWGSFDLGCSFWRPWTGWTRRQVGSFRPHVVHIHNHCQTRKHIHTAPDQYQHVKRDILSYSVFQFPDLLWLVNRSLPGLSVCDDTHHYYVLIRVTVDKCSTAVYGKHGRLCCLTCPVVFPIPIWFTSNKAR